MRTLLTAVLLLLASTVSAQTFCDTSCTAAVGQPFTLVIDALACPSGCALTINGLAPNVPAPVTLSGATVEFSFASGFQAPGAYVFVLMANGVATTDPITVMVCGQYSADYFASQTIGGMVAASRCEGSINNTWGTGGPPEVPVDKFSARWVGAFTFNGATAFTARTDDGMRAWVDGDSLVDAWKDESATTFTAMRTLSGAHTVRVEYYENGGDAVAIFGWLTATDPCVVDPLTFTVNRWPSFSTGTRRLDYSVNKTSNITLYTRASPWRATAVDTRGCSVTVSKP
jgi:hypothetical protein